MRIVLLTALLLPQSALAKKKGTSPTVSPEEAVRGFYAQVDALKLDGPYEAEALVAYTMDAAGSPLTAEGAAGWQAVQDVLTGWGASGGTIASKIEDVDCWVGPELAACAVRVRQEFTLAGEPAGGAEVRASFALKAVSGRWSIVHWHESATTAPE